MRAKYFYYLTILMMFFATSAFAAVNNNGRNNQMNQNGGGKAGSIQWYTDYSQAAKVAKQSNKPLLLFITGSDWCGWCKKLDSEVFATPEFARLAGNDFVFVEVDFPMNKTLPEKIAKQNAEIKQKYGVTGYPTVILLDSSGNYIGETGYRAGGPAAYAEHLKELVKK